jgi:mitochondrial fission protein ELM1
MASDVGSMSSTMRATPQAAPRAWALLGHHPGDNGQVLALARALGWPVDAKRLSYNRRYKWSNLLLGASLLSLDRQRSSPLEPPWPDLVIASGRRSVPVARWIRRRSRGHARLVYVGGRPQAPLAFFDLVITGPQYCLPLRPNVLHNTLPLNRIDAARLAQEAARWAPRLADLPRPFVALLVGGDAPPWVLDPPTAERLGREAGALAGALGGSLLVTCGRRAKAAAVSALFGAIRCPAHLHRWRPDDGDNPYVAYLALADRFVVTGDSASMLAEACATGKPVQIVELPEGSDRRWRATRPLARWIERRQARRSARATPRPPDWLDRLCDRLVGLGLLGLPLDLRRFHRALEARALATRLGQERPTLLQSPPDDMERAVAHVRRLVPDALCLP